MRSTSSREPATQLWPVAAKMPATCALAALSRSASAKTMNGDLPPSSSEVEARFSAELRTMWRAVVGAAGKGDVGDLRMARSARRRKSAPKPVMILTTPGGKAGLVDEPGEFEQRRRAVLRGLDHEGAAGRQRRADLDRREEELAVPGHDGGDDADRLAPEPDLHVGLVDRQMRAFDLVGEARIIAIVVGDIGDLRRGLADDLAGVAVSSSASAARILRDEIGEPIEQLAALRSPSSPAQRPSCRRGRAASTARSTSPSRASGIIAQAAPVAGSMLSKRGLAVFEPPSI